MPTDKFTNSPGASQYLVRTNVRTNVRQHRPYVSSHYTNQLTDKERLARQQLKTASCFGGGGSGGLNTMMSDAAGGNFFSPQLSTDFMELPQSLRELRELYRHYYNTDELVGQAIDLHTELPLSKVRLAAPKPRKAPDGFPSPENYGKYILSRFERMCKRIKLFQRLITMVHHYWLDGTSVVFAEDSVVDIPEDVGYEQQNQSKSVLQNDGTPVETSEEVWVERSDREGQEFAHYQKNYLGWERLIIIPVDRVKVSTWSFTDKIRVELIPSDREMTTWIP